MKHKRKGKKNPRRSFKKRRLRKYLLPTSRCVHLNEKFAGSNAHHLSFNIVMYIPIELHQHIQHSLKSGVGMVEMNLLAMQFLYGGLN